jgi:hypothetical protein
MSVSDWQCEKPDAEICHRFSPAKDANLCLRCGHGQECHIGLGPYGPGEARLIPAVNDRRSKLCVFLRDTKTKDFPLPPVENLEKHWKRGMDIRPGLGMAMNAPAPALNVAKMRVDLYDAMCKLEEDKDLDGFTLARVYVRPGEWKRLTEAFVRYPVENPPKMESGQVGSIWIDTSSANVPVFEHTFLPETFASKSSGAWPDPEAPQRRVICMLQYERNRPQAVTGYAQHLGKSIPVIWGKPYVEIHLRIVTE